MQNLAKYSTFVLMIFVLCGLVFSSVIERAFASVQGNMQSYLPIVMCDDCTGTVATPLPTSTASTIPSATATASTIPSVTATASTVSSATATASTIPSTTATASIVPSATATPTSTPTNTPTPSPTNTLTPSPTNTLIPSPTNTLIPPSPSATTTPMVPLLEAWMLNTTGETAAYIREPNGDPVLVNVQSVEEVTQSGIDFARISASGIPNYRHMMTQAEIDWLNNRPRAKTDFVTGQTSAVPGQTVEFGEDINYVSNAGCPPEAGYGYWPPGPECPSNRHHQAHFPLEQEMTSDICAVGLGTVGLWLNGTSIFNWGDGHSYKNEHVWKNTAPLVEQYDFDICGGHAAMENYHHHSHSNCLAEQLEDDGTGHSPIYGFAADGYPIYGPWQADNVLASSCWKVRDYDNPSSPTGCGVAGERTCVLVDPYDITQGTMPAPSGPDTDGIITTPSGNPLSATSGLYFEDYYYDAACTSQGPEYLDDHNGHIDDERGYHYHITIIENEDGSFDALFPFIIGPTFYGELEENAITNCAGGPPPRK